ncbi:peptidoglycan DD-metalloendopeptidase family protein [Turneriella parva]|uniref:RHS repeat-associated core domain-containing protein n=1 Tax=Turneriella parva (strain ATCC BAA-1111 / DSM 21527 / NCTC 11395 / H) TaxID=869212 RepID=I4B828_TURPD|nr:peptidoglycan DD-metalloendopeptidase family protein [Turneriella parva]AFM13435.1 RHS repeat-associated core domain-containing protein [Turneriella parva DSM 21527]
MNPFPGQFLLCLVIRRGDTVALITPFGVRIYEYYNGRVATGTVAERASLGFEKIKTTDVNSGNYSITTYRQDKPFQGMVTANRSYLANNTLLSEQIAATPQLWLCDETGCTHDVTNNPNPIQPKQIRQSGETGSLSYESGILTGGKFEQIFSQDAYGNPLKTKSRISANGAERSVYRFITYLNETSTTRAIGIPVSEKTCYTETECATGDNDFVSENKVYYDGGALGTIGDHHLVTKKEFFLPIALGTGVWGAEEFTYNFAGGILTKLDDHGVLTSIAYDTDYNQFPVSITKAHGGKSSTVTAAYDPRFGKRISETLVDDATVTATTFDATGFAFEIITQNGSTILARKTASHSMPGVSPIWGETCTHFGNGFTQTRCRRKFSDAMGRVYREEFPELVAGVETQMAIEYKYDNQGRQDRVSRPFDAASGSAVHWDTKTYDNYGRIIQTQSFDNKITSTTYQATGLPAGIVSCMIGTAIDGKQQKTCNNIFDQPAFTIQNFGTTEAIEATYIYDGRGRLVSVGAPQGVTTIGYVGISGLQAFIDDPVSGRTEYTYYAQSGQASFGQLATETSNGKVISLEYNAAFGRLSKITQNESVTTYTYDETDLAFGKNKLTTLTYSVDGYILQERYSHNANGDVVEMTRRFSHSTETLCADMNAMPCLQIYGTTADELGRTKSTIYPDGKITAFSYAGATDHVLGISHDGTTYATYSDYNYDVIAQVGRVTYGNGLRHTYGYQANTGLLSNVNIGKANEPAQMNLTYAYDTSYNIQSITDSVMPNLSVTYQYDGLNRLRKTTYGSGLMRDFRFDHDGAGNSRGNLLQKGNRRMTYAPGKTYPVSDELLNKSTGIWEVHQTMTWSAAGSLLTKGNFTYSYDSNQMMTKAVEGTTAETQFAYDHAGQRFLKKHTRDGVTIKTWYLGDAIELREKYVGVTSSNTIGILDSWQATKYIYGQDGKRIASITGNVQAGAIAATSSTLFALADSYSSSTSSGLAMKAYYTLYGIYAHEDFGRVLRIGLLSSLALALLLWLYFSGVSSAERVVHEFCRRVLATSMLIVFASVYCGQNSLPPGVTQEQINTLISDLYTGLPAGTVYYAHNHLGSGALATDMAGNEIFRIGYTEYGEIDLTNSGKWNPTTQILEQNMSDAEMMIVAVKFTGQEYDPETGFYYFNARYYSAELGVFTTSDTEFDSAGGFGFNRHMYVSGNPIIATDPSGHGWFSDLVNIVSTVINPVGALTTGAVGAVTRGAITKDWSLDSMKQGYAMANMTAAAVALGVMTGGAAFAAYGGVSGGLNAAIIGGMAGGAAGGFAGGAGNAWIGGASFGDGLMAGFVGGVTGALIGGLTAGVGYGLGQALGGGGSSSTALNQTCAQNPYFCASGPNGGSYPGAEIALTDVPIATGGSVVPSAGASTGGWGGAASTFFGGTSGVISGSLAGAGTIQTGYLGESKVLPKGRVTSPYGPRTHPVTGEKKKFHHGTDIYEPVGTPVRAVMLGRVYKVGYNSVRGNYIIINHLRGGQTRYLHLSKIYVKKGQLVHRNDIIGKSGRTGRVTGPHLHFELYLDGKNVNSENYKYGY